MSFTESEYTLDSNTGRREPGFNATLH